MFAVALGLSACATATPYQPLASGNAVSGGYSEQKLDDVHFQVSFRGNDATSRARVETYLLYRAAELTIAHGYDWFEMVDKHTHNNGSTYIEGWGPDVGWGWGGGWGGYWAPAWSFYGGPGVWGGGPWMDDYDVIQDNAYVASAVIAVGKDPKPESDRRAFDARQVLQNLGPKIVRPH